MKYLRITLLSFLALLFFNNVYADNKTDIYKAFISMDISEWKSVIDRMNTKSTKSTEFIKELVNYQYGYIGWCVELDNDDEAETYLELAEANLDILKKDTENLSFVHAYLSAFYGLKISLNIMMAPFYGPKSLENAKISIEKDPDNPIGYIQIGHSEYHMPETFGGSKMKALGYYIKAEQLMNRSPEKLPQDWNYLSLLTYIAQSYSETGQIDKAKEYYLKILNIEPEYKMVKNDLYPNLLKNYKDGKK